MISTRSFRSLAASVLALSMFVGVAQTLARQGSSTRAPIQIQPHVKPESHLRAYVARVDLTDPAVRLRVLPGGDSLDPKAKFPTQLGTVSAIAEREKLAFAVNGDFFITDDPTATGPMATTKRYIVGRPAYPIGNAVTDGKVWHRTNKEFPMLVVDADGKVSIQHTNAIPTNARQVISGNRMLVREGKAVIEHKEGETRHPRTAVGLTADGKTLVLVVVDGRSVLARGMTYGELAAFMVEQGADIALNLDGGGSTTMVQRDGTELKTINTPSDGVLRPVVNAVGIELKN